MKITWKITGIITTTILAMCAGAYKLGKDTSNDTVNQLEKSLSSYEKASKLNTEEFIDSAILVTKELKLSINERKELSAKEKLLGNLKKLLEEQDVSINELKSQIEIRDAKLSTIENNYKLEIDDIKINNNKDLLAKKIKNSELIALLNKYESLSSNFILKKGEGINLKDGNIQVGFSQVEFNTKLCTVSVNNITKQMHAGDFVAVENCKVTLTKCVYGSPSEFQLICP